MEDDTKELPNKDLVLVGHDRIPNNFGDTVEDPTTRDLLPGRLHRELTLLGEFP